MLQFCCRDGHTDQWNRTDNRETKSKIQKLIIFTGTRTTQRRKEQFLELTVPGRLNIHMKRNKDGLLASHHTQNLPKINQGGQFPVSDPAHMPS